MEQAIFNNKMQHYLSSNLFFNFCGISKTQPLHAFGPAYRNHYILHIILEGQGVYYANNQMFSLKAGDLFLIRPDELTFYQADKNQPWLYAWIAFSGEVAKQLVEKSLFSNDQYVLFQQETNEFMEIIQDCLRLNHENMEEEILLTQSLYQLFYLLLKKTDETKVSHSAKVSELTRQSINFVEQQTTNLPSVQEIADELNVDRSHLSRIFSKEMGIPLRRWLLSIKINRAAQLLIASKNTMEEIAFDCGFSSLVSFSRAFKDITNESPLQYRKRLQETKTQGTLQGEIFDLLEKQKIASRAT